VRGITTGDDHAVEVDGIAGAQLADLLVGIGTVRV
jgi:hypothetical protein